ncbi:MAG: hypothetical protein ACJ0BI_10475 [Paracoccaceae bacterium]
MEICQIEEKIANLKGRRDYEEKKASKLGFPTLHEYFEDKIAKELLAAEQKIKEKERMKAPKVKKRVLHKKSSCSCC